jgi:hypothetical protein
MIYDWKKVDGNRCHQRRDTPDKNLTAPAFYVDWWEGTNHIPGFPLYTLAEDIPGHSQLFTVSGSILEAAVSGFRFDQLTFRISRIGRSSLPKNKGAVL